VHIINHSELELCSPTNRDFVWKPHPEISPNHPQTGPAVLLLELLPFDALLSAVCGPRKKAAGSEALRLSSGATKLQMGTGWGPK
jgi:hypothetical protein